MARIRTLKPEFWGDEKLAPMPALTRLVFLGLVSMADDAGRLVDNVKALDGMLFPETDETCRGALTELAAAGRIVRYVSASGQKLIQLANWSRHQKVDHATKYVLPAPDAETVAQSSRDIRESVAQDSRSDLGPTTKDLGPTTNSNNLPAASDDAPGETAEATPPAPAAVAPTPTPRKRKPATPKPDTPRLALDSGGAKWPHFPKADCDAVYAAWSKLGAWDYARVRKAHAPLYGESGPRFPTSELVKGITEAIEDATTRGGAALGSLTPETFVTRAAHWIGLASMPFVDAMGNPTARGISIGMSA